jgi:DNA polymerase-4
VPADGLPGGEAPDGRPHDPALDGPPHDPALDGRAPDGRAPDDLAAAGRAPGAGCALGGSSILHVDMDAFFASVEVRARPELRGRPVIVGGGPRGVVTSATYEARRFGVRSAMPLGQARALCPGAVFVPVDHATYRRVSAKIMEIFHGFTPLVAPLSLDEAFLDVSGARRRLGSPVAIATALRATIAAEQDLTCSVGVAPSMFVAKIASARAKPDGMRVVEPDGVLEFLRPLPVSALWGVGDRTEQRLRELGLHTIGDIAVASPATLRYQLGEAAGTHLHALANGVDDRAVTPGVRERSVSAEETFPTDIAEDDLIVRELLRLADRVAARLRARAELTRTVSIKIRYSDFSTVNRSRTLAVATDETQTIFGVCRELFGALAAPGRAIRLVGVRAERLVTVEGHSRQLALGEAAAGWRDLDAAVDGARRRFGSASVTPASLLSAPRVADRPVNRPPSAGRGPARTWTDGPPRRHPGRVEPGEAGDG